MASLLKQLKTMTTIVADTGDIAPHLAERKLVAA